MAAETIIEKALLAHLVRSSRPLPEPERLRYSSDLSPDACNRSIFYRLSGAQRDPETLGEQLRFKGGHIFEALGHDALRAFLGKDAVFAQENIRPLRPSAWAFAAGHADVVLAKEKRLLEFKAPRANAFEWAGDDNKGLVREGYRWQASSYFWELKGRGVVESAAWIFLDREGSHSPVEVELEGDLLIPLEKIVEEEKRKASIFWPRAQTETAPLLTKEVPDRLPREVSVSALKGRGKDGRTLSAAANLHWKCSYCQFSKFCKPGPKSAIYELTDEEKSLALQEAEKRWAQGEQRVTVKLPPCSNDDESIAEVTGEPTPSSSLAAPKEASSSAAPPNGNAAW